MDPVTVCAHNSTPANPHPWVDFDRERLVCATGVTRPADSRTSIVLLKRLSSTRGDKCPILPLPVGAHATYTILRLLLKSCLIKLADYKNNLKSNNSSNKIKNGQKILLDIIPLTLTFGENFNSFNIGRSLRPEKKLFYLFIIIGGYWEGLSPPPQKKKTNVIKPHIVEALKNMYLKLCPGYPGNPALGTNNKQHNKFPPREITTPPLIQIIEFPPTMSLHLTGGGRYADHDVFWLSPDYSLSWCGIQVFVLFKTTDIKELTPTPLTL
ncbi:hypothetical protein AGLY_012611 [Aphis glycines]|uniref:Uncharacterized protein n=1 Tax=Aphis glycines TaxID=307491 RepID=A0A6G0T9G0_APHGL|nr:hypothetical protein AGLY_012611 [Aphis glycines]